MPNPLLRCFLCLSFLIAAPALGIAAPALGIAAPAMGIAAPAMPADQFAWSAPLELDGRGGLYAAEATPALYAGLAAAHLADLRVRNGAGETVPHAVRLPPVPAAAPPRLSALPAFPLWAAPGEDAGALSVRVEQRPGGTIVHVAGAERGPGRPRLVGYLVDATAFEGPIEALHLEWDGSGFAGRVRVEASDDLARWTTRAADAPVLALVHEGHALGARRIAIPGTRAKYLRLSWPAGQQTPEFRTVRAEAAPALPERVRVWQRHDAARAERATYEIDLGGAPPVDRLRVELPMNAVLPVEVYARRERSEPWRRMATDTLYRLERGGAVMTRDEVGFAPATDRLWMLKVDPRADLAEGALRVHAGYVPHEIVFAARGEPPFTLVFGSARATSTALPLGTLVPGYDATRPLQAARATVGMPRPAVREPGRWPDWLEAVDRKRAVLWAVLVCGVLVLGIAAWRLARQTS
jgi:hypothetical protein